MRCRGSWRCTTSTSHVGSRVRTTTASSRSTLESLLMSFTPSIRPFTGSFQGWGYLDQPVTYGSWLFAGAMAVLVVWRVRFGRSHWAVLTARHRPVRWRRSVPSGSGRSAGRCGSLPFAMILLAVATVVILERGGDGQARSERHHGVGPRRRHRRPRHALVHDPCQLHRGDRHGPRPRRRRPVRRVVRSPPDGRSCSSPAALPSRASCGPRSSSPIRGPPTSSTSAAQATSPRRATTSAPSPDTGRCS